MKLNQFFLTMGLLIATSLTFSCFGDDGKDGASCITNPKENAADGFDVICDGKKVGELSNGKDADCIIEPSRLSPGVYDVICNDQKVGELSVQGQQGESCSVADDPNNSAYLKMTCGSGETKTEKTWAKAVCGGNAFDPEIMTCNKSILSFSFTDARDSRKYKAVVIGNQTWMAENLNYGGDISPASGSSSSSLLIGKCYGEGSADIPTADVSSNCAKYGRLYDWATAMGIDASYNSTLYTGSAKKKDLCPAGWHLPTNEEWLILINSVGGTATAGVKLKAASDWEKSVEYVSDCVYIDNSYKSCEILVSGNGTDDYGFSALPGGSGSTSGYYYNLGIYGYWWTSSEVSSNTVNSWRAHRSNTSGVYTLNKANMYSIRCVKN